MGSRSGCLPRGIPYAMPRHAVQWQPHRVSVTNCFTGEWAAVGGTRLSHTYLTCSLALFILPPLHTTAHHCTPLQSRSPTSNSQPRQRIPLAVVMPCNLALQGALVPAEAGCSPACHEAVHFCCRSVPSIPDWFLQKPCAPAWEGTGRVGCRLCIAPLLLFFTVEINLEIKSTIKKETHPLLSPPLPSPSSDGE